jgi:hypothetical protein
MTNRALLRELLESQSSDGAFPSTIHFRDREQTDWNGFATALVLRALLDENSPAFRTAREKALDFLNRCESPVRPGAFGFWPTGTHPPGMPRLPQDADDTAIDAVLLARSGRLDRRDLRTIALDVLLPHRLDAVQLPAPVWMRSGVFRTWLRRDWPPILDCCVNANVLGFLAYAGLDDFPGGREATIMLEEGIRWAGDSPARACSLSPYYPDPAELRRAVDHAVECGAAQLKKSLELLRALPWSRERPGSGPPQICGTTYGRIVWTSRAVEIARALKNDSSTRVLGFPRSEAERSTPNVPGPYPDGRGPHRGNEVAARLAESGANRVFPEGV